MDWTSLSNSILSEAMQSTLAQWLIIIAIVWQVMGKKVAGHFKGMERAVSSVAIELTSFRKIVEEDLKLQALRLEKLENRVLDLERKPLT